MESQAHGLLFEDAVIRAKTGMSKKEYQAQLENSYTASMDMEPGVGSDVKVSIKVCDGGGIGCGDILRFIRHCKNDRFVMVVGVWLQIDKETKRYDTIYEFDLAPEHYDILWSGITEEVMQPFVDYVKAIPSGATAREANEDVWKQKRQEIYDKHGQGLCSIAAKIGSDSQRRVQASINLKELIAETKITHRKYDKDYNGISLPYEQKSPPRQRKKT
jgi:hypothetical protein